MTNPVLARLTPRHTIVLDAYQRCAANAAYDVEVDEHGDRWGVAVYLDDMWPMIVEEINGRDEVRAVVLDLATLTEGEFSSVVEDEFGETRVVFDAGIIGRGLDGCADCATPGEFAATGGVCEVCLRNGPTD